MHGCHNPRGIPRMDLSLPFSPALEPYGLRIEDALARRGGSYSQGFPTDSTDNK